MSESRQLGPGVRVRDDRLEIDAPVLLEHLGLPDTPENRLKARQCATAIVKAKFRAFGQPVFEGRCRNCGHDARWFGRIFDGPPCPKCGERKWLGRNV